MTLPLHIARKLLELTGGQGQPASTLKHAIVAELIEEGIIIMQISGRTKRTLYVPDAAALSNYLSNRFGIPDLAVYIATLSDESSLRADLVVAAADSKAARRRTFKGFLVNTTQPLQCRLNGEPFQLQPQPGSFQFVYDWEQFSIPADVVVVGIENAECFRFADKLRHYLHDAELLFVCRYPLHQYGDLISWLQQIPNRYVHMGDYDFAGINIYMQEYKRQLGARAGFFIPPNIEHLMIQFGNRELYDAQQLNASEIDAPELKELIGLLHQHKKGLEQEVLLTTAGS